MFVAVLFAIATLAERGEDYDHHHTHEHGRATLTLASEDSMLHVEFRVDQSTALGFEHQPTSASETKKLVELQEHLANPNAAFSLATDPACTPEAVSAELEHSLDPLEPEDHSDGHADFVVTMRFTCMDTPTIDSLDVTAFDLFPSLDEVNVTVLTASQQTEAEATRARPNVRF